MKTLIKAFISFKLFQLALSILLITIAYNLYPASFHFIFKILSNLK
jgi:hypothetical protein